MARYSKSSADSMARGLGWFSIALGLAEVAAGRDIARWLGMAERSRLIRLHGLREIVQGVGLLAVGDRRPWMWARVAGDALDAATLAPGLDRGNRRRDNVALALAVVAGAAALDAYCTRALHRQEAARPTRHPDYGDRSGFPRPPRAMRGIARNATPADLRPPPLMRFPQPQAEAGRAMGR